MSNTAMRSVPLTLGSGNAVLAATAWLPDSLPQDACPPVFVAFPGGGYARGYFDLNFAGHSGYSQAEHHVAAGAIVVGCDHLGVGQSSRVDDPTLTVDEIVAADAAAVVEVRQRLCNGTLVKGLDPIADPLLIGMGQSMGGCFSILMQGRFAVFEALAVLGYSAVHSSVAFGLQNAGVEVGELAGLFQDTSLTRAEASATVRPAFFDGSVPEDIVAADLGGGYPLRRTIPAWGSLTPPGIGNLLIQPGAVAPEAAAITCPVFIAFGDIDLAQEPRRDPAAYAACRDIELMIVPDCAHMHNFAKGRALLWDRLIHWASRLGA